ncbi:hypothetical protein SAMN05421855_101303 [Ulvibacter litoralis]|uniref:Tetratricopeptide repeat-containing protein n=2 Tax=Ulvibacter litoralis TaxID=227084 RepID=A0A1G7CEE1_9FLAO|nr:hypothetical protein SAMN05421855_101303 [Ulvibacter litoralis]
MASLDTVIENYPYFQSARALQLKGLKNQSSFLYNDALKTTAAYTTDRDILFEYITSEKFIQNDISKAIVQHDISFNDIEVISENVSESISIEIDNQLKAELKKAEAVLNPDLFERKTAVKASEVTEDTQNPAEATEKAQITPETTSESEAPSAAEILELDKPLEFTKADTHSFSEWLQLTRTKPIIREKPSEEKSETPKVEVEKTEVQDEKERKFELIEKFIQEKPKLKPKAISGNSAKEKKENINLASPYTQAPDALMTETLAKVYLQQKNYTKAIQAYKILILKYPEKSGFFADQIRAVKKLINTEEK